MKESDTKCYTSVDIGKAVIGNDQPMTIPLNGYLAVYLSNASSIKCEGCMNSEGDVYFDKIQIRFTRGNLKQETHYYPFGLPMAGIGSSAVGMTPNREKYQSNEYITDAGLNWMSFGARQYDPQLGRFLSVDPMASDGGQDMLSPYQAMGNNPANYVDPDGKLLVVDASDLDVIAKLNAMFGNDTYAIDDQGVVNILPGEGSALYNNLVNFFMDGGSIGTLSGGSMGGPGITAAGAFTFASIVYNAITNGDPAAYSIAPFHGKMTFGTTDHSAQFYNYTLNQMPEGRNDQFGWFTRFEDWLIALFQGHSYEQIPDKHITDQGGLELVGNKHGENLETRVTTRDDIIRYNVDWLLDMSDAYTPNIFPNLKLPFFAEYMENMTDNINAVNAAIEISRDHFHYQRLGAGYMSSADPVPVGTDSEHYMNQYYDWVDSMDKASRK